MQAKIIDRQHPYYGLVCEIGSVTDGIYTISPVGQSFRNGYAYKEQMEEIKPCTCSECRMERARAHDTGRTFTDHNGYKFPEE